MDLTQLLPLADGWDTLAQALESLRRGSRAVLLEGLPAPAKGFVLAKIARELNKPLVIVTISDEQAARLQEDLAAFLPPDEKPLLLPSSLSLLLDDEESGRDVARAGRRMAALTTLAGGDTNRTIIAPATALLQKTPPPDAVKNKRITLTAGQSVNLDTTVARLVAFGYSREEQVNLPGSFARRGDILDVFPSDADTPVRVDLFGDDIETIRPFDRETQRSFGKLESVTLVPAHEVAYTRENMASASAKLKAIVEERAAEMAEAGADAEHLERLRDAGEADVARLGQAVYFAGIERYLSLLHPDTGCALDYLPADSLLVLDEPAQAGPQAARDIEQVETNLQGRINRGEIPPLVGPLCQAFDEGIQAVMKGRQTVLLSLLARTLPFVKPDAEFDLRGVAAPGFGGRPTALADALGTYLQNNVRAVVVSAQAPRVRGVLNERKLPEAPLATLTGGKGGIALVNGLLHGGFALPDARLVVLSDAEIFGTIADKRKEKRKQEFRGGMRLTSLMDLKTGDYVVHINHGVGQYQGMMKLNALGVEREYLLVVYEGGDKLYVPVDQIDRVQKYIGSEGAPPNLNKLGGTEWARATARAKKAVQDIAKDLIALYAARQHATGHAYGEDTPWQQDMEGAFPYVETPDQDAAIRDVKRDLESPRPMDRLIVGDVGFGKTEVAMRAAFKVAGEGKQVSVLCPTTVLAAQHFHSFSERLKNFPLKVEMLSRFRSPVEQKKILEEVRVGAVDILIGTHRLLGKDVAFKDLGMVVVDEEQRFGVTHKEKLKQLRKTVDVLTMTATPIPRTLHMSLSGIRDMSLMNDPPEGRTAVKTLIKEYDEDLIREHILREVDRGGQVYFVHNRIESIYHVASRLEKIVPTARFRIGHGQMNEDDLEETMLDFYENKFDVLLSTTIIESGLDIPNANTIIIDNADKMGLGQLYQLRGRVGRSRVQAHCLMLYRRNKQLSQVAEQRLGALREFSELGAGYKIALRDLEIRGAGNLLGAEQSGTVAAIGFDLYTQLLEQAVREYKGEEADPNTIPLPTVDLPIAASIPEKYVPGEAQRILMYKKLSAVRDTADVARLQEEFEDRFGDPPPPVWNALALLRLRLRCREVGIEAITTDKNKIAITFKRGVKLPVAVLRPLGAAYKAQGHTFTQEKVVMNAPSASNVLRTVEEMVEVLHRALHDKPPAPRTTPPNAPPATRKAITTRH